MGLAHDVAAHSETDPRLSGGGVEADWVGAYASGEESVGGSVATPDQDVVDELGRALGVEQESDALVRTSDEILRARDAPEEAAGKEEPDDAKKTVRRSAARECK